MERLDLQRRAMEAPVLDAEIQDYVNAPFGRFGLGAVSSTVGAGLARGSMAVERMFSGPTPPLNLTISIEEAGPEEQSRYDLSLYQGNNPAAIAADLNELPASEHPWLLSSPDWGTYQDRKMFLKMRSPEAQAQASTPGYLAGMAADIGVLTTIGLVAEPLALAGLGARTTMAGQVATRTIGAQRTQHLAMEAAEAAATISRTNLGARYMALGVAEEAVYQASKNAIDPTYDPTFGQAMFDFVLSGTLAGTLGGVAFGRQFVKSNIEEAVKDFAAMRQVDLPGGYKITYGTGWGFDSPAAADKMMFAPGTGNLEFEADRIAGDLWADWSRLAGPKADFFIPGTRTTPIGAVEAGVAEPMRVRVGETQGLRSAIKAAAFELDLAGMKLDKDVFTKVAMALVKTDQKKLTAGGFNKAFWDELLQQVDPEVAGKVRKVGERAFIGGIDKSVLDVARREDMVTSVYQAFRTGQHLQPDAPPSLIFKVLQEIQQRGGTVNRETVANVIDELRVVSQSPPKRLNRKGVMTLDVNARRAQVFQIINKRVTDSRQQRGVPSINGLNPHFPNQINLPDGIVASQTRLSDDYVNDNVRYVFTKGGMNVGSAQFTYDDVNKMYRPTAFVGVQVNEGFRGKGVYSSLVKSMGKNFPVGSTATEYTPRGAVVNTTPSAARAWQRAGASKKSVLSNPKFADDWVKEIYVISPSDYLPRTVGIDISPSLLKRLSSDVAARIPTPAVPSAVTGGVSADASDVPVNRVRIPWWDRIGNQSAFVHQSKNGWARLVGNLSFFARRDMGTAQAHTIFEWGSQKMYATFAMFSKGYRNGFVRFALGGGTENAPRNVTLADQLVTMFKNRSMRQEFDARVVRQLRTGTYDDAVDAVNETAKGIREMFNRVHDLAHSVGLAGFQKSAVVNYMPRMWRWDRIRILASTAQGKKSLQDLIRQSIDMNGRRVVIDGVEQVFEGDIDAAAKSFTERLVAIAEGTENAPLVQQEQELFDAIVALEGPLKARSGSRSPYGRSRMLLNEMAQVEAGNDLLAMGKTGLSFADLTNDDLSFVFRKYITSVMGAINEKRLIDGFNDEMRARGILSPEFMTRNGLEQKDVVVENVSQMLAMVRKLGGAMEDGTEESIRELVSALKYEPIHHGRTRFTDKVLPLIQSYGYLVTGGQFGLAALGEVSRIVASVGMVNTIKQMPILLEMVENWKNLDAEGRNFASALDSWFSPSTDRLRRAFTSYWDESVDTSRGAQLARGMLQKASNFMSDVSLLSPVNSFTQHLTAAATLQHLWEAAMKGGKRLDDSSIRILGLSPERYNNLVDWVGRNAVTKAGFMGDRVVDLRNIDQREMVELAQMVDRMVRTRIQDVPTRGDFSKHMFSFLGKLLTQFRTFNIKGIDNFLLQNASRMASGASGSRMQVASEIGATMVFAGTIQWMRSAADWVSYTASGDRERAEKIEEQMDYLGFIRGAMSGPSEFYVPALLTDVAWTRMFDKDPIFSPYRYSGLSMYEMPAWAIGSRAAEVTGDVYGATVGKAFGLDLEREITSSTLHKARLLLPFQNLPLLKQYFNIQEREISNWLDLPEMQPRKTRK